jgi:hypothetical protein
MNDREFIDLLNLYVDREISAEDALRLEAEVAADRERRKVYDQYCRMQKACSMLSAQYAESAAGERGGYMVEFPAPRAWRLAPILAGLAAACVVAVVGLRYRGTVEMKDSPGPAVESGGARSIPDTMELSRATDPMKSVFSTRPSGSLADRSVAAPMFAVDNASPQIAPLNWIGDIHMAPVFSAASSDLLLTARPDLKTPISNEAQSVRYPQEPAEMTAFRFQR